jgi:hypothetical protein
MDKQKTVSYFVRFFKILLIVLAVGLIAFSLMSGAENSGFLKNIPNSFPWILLLIFAGIAFWKQIFGGILIVLFGIFTILFFSAFEFLWILFVISLPLIVIGLVLALAGLFKNK